MASTKKNESARMREIREKANEQRRAELKAAARRRALIQAGIIAVIIAVVAGGAFAVYNASRGSSELTIPDATATVSVDGAETPFSIDESRIRIGADDAPVTVGLVEDYSCPHFQEYEAEIGSTITDLVADGSIAFEMTPVQIVTNYGVRAGSAAACVAVDEPSSWLTVHEALFERHDGRSDGWRNTDLREFVEGLGVSNTDALDCIEDGTYENWIRQNTTAASEAGITSTPTLLIDGEAVSRLTAEQLRARVASLSE
ncbi:DsbA family protein [Labedella endophytica]|nr:thioredoxin domain-containing protein [Labedella endophytica]